MTPKTKRFVKYSVIFIIIAVILGGCGKDDKDKEVPTPEKNGSDHPTAKVESTPLPVDNTYAIEKIKAAAADRKTGIAKIISSAEGWSSVLADYNGQNAPNMIFKDINGKEISISSLKGKKAIVVKWLSMHKESKQMVKDLAELQTQIGADNLAVIAFSRETSEVLKGVVEEMGIPFSVAGKTNRRLIPPYRTIPDVPVSFFIDKAGKIQLIAKDPVPAEVLKSIVDAL